MQFGIDICLFNKGFGEVKAKQTGSKFSPDNILKYLYFSQEIGFDITCKLGTICIKYQILFPEKKQEKILLI